MKTVKIALLLFSTALLCLACQKEPLTKEVHFTSTEYKVLAPTIAQRDCQAI